MYKFQIGGTVRRTPKDTVDMVQDEKWVTIREKLEKAIRSERPGMPVMIAELRKALPGTHPKDFDLAILDLAESGRYFLSRHFHSAQPSVAEKAAMVPDGEGGLYFSINHRDDVDIPSQVDVLDEINEHGNGPSDPVSERTTTGRKNGTSAASPGRGGSRAGAGRPAVKKKIKRVPLQGARVPGWLMDWLKSEKDMGHKIEAALIEYYGLTPPKP
jgi:hypothetical protein